VYKTLLRLGPQIDRAKQRPTFREQHHFQTFPVHLGMRWYWGDWPAPMVIEFSPTIPGRRILTRETKVELTISNRLNTIDHHCDFSLLIKQFIDAYDCRCMAHLPS
jgi:hypothetical protein